MTDVAKKIITANAINNNRIVTGSLPTGRYSVREGAGVDESVPMSGVNGQTTNGYLDRRFDDPTYYTA